MLNIFTNSEYGSFPLFLHVNINNSAAIKCYTKNQFQKVEDVFSTRPGRPIGVRMKTKDNMFMCYNRNALKVSYRNEQYELMPIGSYRITLIAHGALAGKEYTSYSFPFKNMQYYTKKGSGVLIPKGIDEANAIYHVCYDKIISTYKDEPEPKKKILSLIPMLFRGFKKGDPISRKNFIGLYDCNMKKRIKENYELFGENNENTINIIQVIQMINTYCTENQIPVDNVEIKIFACRGYCQEEYADEYATLAISGGNNDDSMAEVESITNYTSVNKDDFFNYLKKEMSSCPLPQKQSKKKSTKKKSTKKKSTKKKRTKKKSTIKKSTIKKTRKYKKYT